MRTSIPALGLLLASAVLLTACHDKPAATPDQAAAKPAASTVAPAAASSSARYASRHLGDYATVKLTADLSHLDAKQKKMVGLLIQAADQMNPIYWKQSVANADALRARIHDDATRELFDINYGPWDRLNADHPFVAGVGPRPPGAQFYPADMTKAEFDKSPLKDKTSLYTLLRPVLHREDTGELVTVPYHVAYKPQLDKAADLLRQASTLAEDPGFAKYLKMRADALQTDDYQPSDFAWMDMKNNPVDIVIGPIETYEDQLFGYKAAYESYVLIKDQAWSEKLKRFAKYLPQLQRDLPVPAKYKAEKPGSDADLNAYFAVYYAGDANVGAKTIAINLPNDEQVQLKKGTRRLQLENVMQAKFDKIMKPIAATLIAKDQLDHVTFDAFFQNTMFHEVAHGLGIKNTLDGKGTVRKALKEYASSFEEGKADILGLYMVRKLGEMGELDKSKLMDNYVTFLAGMLRSVRFGATDAHAQANMLRFNYFLKHGAITRDADTGRYRVHFDKMTQAMTALTTRILTLQGDGDYADAKKMGDAMGVVGPQLASDLKRLDQADIPVDIRFEQGAKVLGLDDSEPSSESVPR
ncbi:hypothetical protein GCM10027285_08470 [Oleiagrimonas citrea]|uniref:Zn-dependent hydrolase n=1 Tax=Oleiagrimonas citrea TaxID=1665687 RepID=A0A846ZLZ3_9GAMM|nr:Zn-dependent hydrolase [Oleiagrimonas citrea]NKZ38589.1 Zn-dependent hydrolase [Oleiagrimonas citrea]